MNKKEIQKDIDDALKYEENLQHDENEEPVTFVNSTETKKEKNGK